MHATNPFDVPTTPWINGHGATPTPPLWPAVPVPPAAVQHPSGTAIDMTTGEVLMKADGKTPYTQDELLLEWQQRSTELAALKAAEMALRKNVVRVYTNPEKITGTERVELGNGYELKAVKGIDYVLGSKIEDDPRSHESVVKAVLAEISKLGPEAAFIAARLVRFQRPLLAVDEYKQAPESVRALIDTVLITKPKSPTLEIVPPKEARA